MIEGVLLLKVLGPVKVIYQLGASFTDAAKTLLIDRVGVFCKAPEYKKSPMPWGFHSTRLLWFAMLFWASEMAAVTLN